MQWSKFIELQAQHPQIIGSLIWNCIVEFNEEFVRTKVGFIAFRPFESLDLSASSSLGHSPVGSRLIHLTNMDSYEAIQYRISFRPKGEEKGPRGRMPCRCYGGISIRNHMVQIAADFERSETFRGKPISWEYVIKRTLKGHLYFGLKEVSIDIYPYPQDYSIEKDPAIRARKARQATEDHKDRLNRARETCFGKLAPLLVGQKLPFDVCAGTEIIIPAGRKIARTFVRRMIHRHELLILPSDPFWDQISEIVGSYKQEIKKIEADRNDSSVQQ